MLIVQDDSDLVPPIYDGPFEMPMWSTFLDRLRQRTAADYAVISFRPPNRPLNSVINLHSGKRLPEGLWRLYVNEAYKRDPIPYFLLREERVYSLSELIAADNPAHGSFVDEMLKPHGMDALRVIRVTEAGGVSAWLTISRARSDFTASESLTLSKVAPHFRRALRSYAEIERQKTSGRIAAEVMKRLNFGWIGLDAKGRILAESTEATALLRHGAGLKRTGSGFLIAADPLVHRQLSSAIRALGGRDHCHPRAFNVNHDPWVDLLVTQAKSQPTSPTQGPTIILYIQGDNRSVIDRHEQLAELFGLLPSEARFALALSRGQSIAEAAGTLGITLETARNYSKKVYAKMGARGQADLIRFVLTSVLALA